MRYLLILCILLPIFITGCSTLMTDERPAELNKLAPPLDKKGNEIIKETDNIDTLTNNPKVLTSTSKIRTIATDIATNDNNTVVALADDYKVKERQIAQFRTDKDRQLRPIWVTMIIIGIIGIIAGFAIIALSKMALAEIGTAVLVLGGFVLTLGLGLWYFGYWIAIIGGVGIGITVITILFRFWRQSGLLNDFADNIDISDKIMNKISDKSKKYVAKTKVKEEKSKVKENVFSNIFDNKQTEST